MKNKIIEEQLSKVQFADLSDYNPLDNSYRIPKINRIKLDVNSCYLIRLKDCLLRRDTSQVLSSNWNKGTVPPCKCMKVDVCRTMGKLVNVNGIGYDEAEKKDLDVVWSGWLPMQDIEILGRI